MRAASEFGHADHGPETCTVTLFTTIHDDALQRRVRGEFRDMPGMRLTIEQATRLWTLDRDTCAKIFRSLVAAGFLETDVNGRYRKAHGGY
jgi:hypothetical protein